MKKLSKSLFLFLTMPILSAAQAGAQVIIQDNFTGTPGNSIGGQAPSGVNLPGGTYFTLPNAVTYAGSGQASLFINTAADIPFFSNTYTPPDDLQISANLTVGSIQSNAFYRGVGLGFYDIPQNLSNNGPQEGSADFFGVV